MLKGEIRSFAFAFLVLSFGSVADAQGSPSVPGLAHRRAFLLLVPNRWPGTNHATPPTLASAGASIQDAQPSLNRRHRQSQRHLQATVELLQKVPPPNTRDGLAEHQIWIWSLAGGSRLDRDLDGKIDEPGAAVLDAAWPAISDAVYRAVLGPLADRLEQLDPPFDLAMFAGSTRYVDKDIRALLGKPELGAFGTRFCGGGDVSACARSVWAAIDAAAAQLEAAQGPDTTRWREDATGERIHFAPGILPNTMRWANRPTFQQVLSFASHR